MTVDPSGQVLNSSLVVVGQIHTDDTPTPSPTARAPVAVGVTEPATMVVSVPVESIGQIRYPPLSSDVFGTRRVVGFGRIRIETATLLRKEPVAVAPMNASATLRSSPMLTIAEWNEIFAATNLFPDQFLLAPALVRALP